MSYYQAVVSTALFSLSAALSIHGASEVPNGQGFIHLPVSMDTSATLAHAQRRSGTTGSAPLENGVYADLVNITIGGQTVSVLLDTGSFELWVDPDCSSFNATGDEPNSADAYLCATAGRYSPSVSETAVVLNESFSVQYGIGSATGTYYSDDVEIGGITVESQHFAVANSSTGNPTGILGIGPDPYGGYNMSEADVGKDLDTYMASPYSLLLTSMVSQGLINSRTFSLDLGNLYDPTGSLIFGGVDRGRFEGTLQTFPLLHEYGSATLENGSSVEVPLYSYFVNATSYSITLPNTQTAQSLNLSSKPPSYPVIDSGTTYLYLPGDLMAQTCSTLGGTVSNGLCSVGCSLFTASGGFNVHIDGGNGDAATFQIPYSNLLYSPSSTQPAASKCQMLMAAATSDIPAILGTPFLRSVYAVFDWDNEQVSLGSKANCTSAVVAVGSGSGADRIGGGCGSSSVGARAASDDYRLAAMMALFSALVML